MAEFTKGPWAVDVGGSVVCPERFEIGEVHSSQLYVDYDTTRHPSDDPAWNRDLSDQEFEANARLIAAAPDLAETGEALAGTVDAYLEWLAEGMTPTRKGDDPVDRFNRRKMESEELKARLTSASASFRAALNKARGIPSANGGDNG